MGYGNDQLKAKTAQNITKPINDETLNALIDGCFAYRKKQMGQGIKTLNYELYLETFEGNNHVT